MLFGIFSRTVAAAPFVVSLVVSVSSAEQPDEPLRDASGVHHEGGRNDVIADGDVGISMQERFRAWERRFAGQELRPLDSFGEEHSFANFAASVAEAARIQSSIDPNAHYSADFSPFAALSHQQRTSLFLRSSNRDGSLSDGHGEAPQHKYGSGIEDVSTTSFDWRERNATSPVKNQGLCGSCWAFAAVGAVEGAAVASKLVVAAPSLSAQEIVDCDGDDGGCSGGDHDSALKWLEKKHSGPLRESRKSLPQSADKKQFPLVAEAVYPYAGYRGNGKCKLGIIMAAEPQNRFFVHSSFYIHPNENAMARALMRHGPLAASLNAMWMFFYVGGVSDPAYCPYWDNHSVLLVGFGAEGDARGNGGAVRPKASGKKFWVVKNSFSAAWGEKGYYRLVRGRGACGIHRSVYGVSELSRGELLEVDAEERSSSAIYV